ncbi:MAG TPA: sigma factor-like helix-turn-helix DNA-binding protein, partial [Saprospiraceae bacterium]|nr:sigma factor-like helix-turn-helix DNA-binding protein [Saprospiraceae bacterium]
PDPLPDEQLYLAERRAATYRALLDLAPGERQIIELSFDDTHPLTDAEIAEQLHIQPASVPVKRARAVAKLRSLMRQRGYT